MLILGSGGHDGEGPRFHGGYGLDAGHGVCGVAVGVKGAEMPWEVLSGLIIVTMLLLGLC